MNENGAGGSKPGLTSVDQQNRKAAQAWIN
jgi:hypothetical protein